MYLWTAETLVSTRKYITYLNVLGHRSGLGLDGSQLGDGIFSDVLDIIPIAEEAHNGMRKVARESVEELVFSHDQNDYISLDTCR